MEKEKLVYRFHNPNTVEATADFLVKLFVEANMGKVERAIAEAARKKDEEGEHSAG